MDLSDRQGQLIKKAAEEGGLIAKFRNMLNRRTSTDRFMFGDDAPGFGSEEPEFRTYTNIGSTIGSDFRPYNPFSESSDHVKHTLGRGMAGTDGSQNIMYALSASNPDDYSMYVNKNPFGGYAANIMMYAGDGKGGILHDHMNRELRNTININGLDEQSARALAAAMEDKDLGLRKALHDSWNARDLSATGEGSKNAVKEVMWKGRLEPYDFVIHDAIESAKKKMKSGQEVADDVDFQVRSAQGGSPYDAYANKFNSKAAIPYIKAQKGLRRELLRGMVGDEAYAELQKGHGLALGPTQDKLTAFLVDGDYENSKGLSKSLLRQLKDRKLSSTAKLTGAAGLASAVGANIAPFVGEESDTTDILRNGIATTALMAPSAIEAVRKGKDAVKDWNVNQDRIARWTDVGSGLDPYSKRELKSLLKGVKPRGGMPAALMGAGVSGLSFLPLLTKGLRGKDKAEEIKMPSALGGGSIPSAVGSSAAPKPTSPSVAAPLDKKASVYGALAALYGRI